MERTDSLVLSCRHFVVGTNVLSEELCSLRLENVSPWSSDAPLSTRNLFILESLLLKIHQGRLILILRLRGSDDDRD